MTGQPTLQRELKTAALAAAGRGWRVFPLRPNSTAPAVRDWRARATDDAERIARCWDTCWATLKFPMGPALKMPTSEDADAPLG